MKKSITETFASDAIAAPAAVTGGGGKCKATKSRKSKKSKGTKSRSKKSGSSKSGGSKSGGGYCPPPPCY